MGTKATLVWILSHVGITENDKADFRPILASATSYRLLNTFQYSRESGLVTTPETCILHVVNPRSPSARDLGIIPWQFAKRRRHLVALHRIRSGHNLLNKYRHRIDNGADPKCRLGCAVIEDSAHLILDCPDLEQFRSNLRLACAKLKSTSTWKMSLASTLTTTN